MAAEIQQLSDLIASSVSTLLQACEDCNTPFPDPNQPVTPQSEAFRASQVVMDATSIIAASALQLAARVLPPHTSLMNIMSGHYKSAALRTALELNVTEILREAGPQGMHIGDIAKICNVDGNKLGESFLPAPREVTPDVFTNTRISTVIDSGKSVADILKNPEDKHEGTPGVVALVEHLVGDCAKLSSQLLENLKDPITGRSNEPNHAPFNRVFNVDTPLWLWYETKEQVYRRRRFAIAMRGVTHIHDSDLLDDVIDWKALPQGSIIVDVGGGMGQSSVAVAKKNDHLKFVVQDLPMICAEATAYWSKENPELIETGKLSFAPHDFFTPQPVANASVFILKQILHDWSDPYCTRILKELRAAATPKTKLIVFDAIISYACHDPPTESGLDSGHKEAPAPLLANYGTVNVMPYLVDIALMLLINSQERTIRHLDTLLRSTGWRIVSAKRCAPLNSFYEPVVAVPL
ncbi:hypothetical protein C0992_006574 [Termitomyces sp. T32_za158]|nr:hypothetical protein C0992_006574 [Termitomyces sp. T32_za158]